MELERHNQELGRQFSAVVEQKKADFAKERKRFPEKPEQLSAEQNRKIEQLANESNATIQQFHERAAEELSRWKTYYDNLLADQLRGPVQDIAKRRGLTVVLVEPAAYYHTPDADVTGEVLELLSTTSSTTTKLPSPAEPATTDQPTGASGAGINSGPPAGKSTSSKEPTVTPSSKGADKSTGGAPQQKAER